MSADRWSVCPKCYEDHLEKIAEMEKDLEASYGKVPIEVYRQKEELLKLTQELDPKTTLREDWELYLEGAELHIRYEASCEECKLHFKMNEAHDIVKGAA